MRLGDTKKKGSVCQRLECCDLCPLTGSVKELGRSGGLGGRAWALALPAPFVLGGGLAEGPGCDQCGFLSPVSLVTLGAWPGGGPEASGVWSGVKHAHLLMRPPPSAAAGVSAPEPIPSRGAEAASLPSVHVLRPWARRDASEGSRGQRLRGLLGRARVSHSRVQQAGAGGVWALLAFLGDPGSGLVSGASGL